jgi:hypothetical protein
VWPYILESIGEQPVFGYGRDAMNRNGLREKIFRATGENFGHPHNGYFQFALDNGLLGLASVVGLLGTLLLKSVVLFRRNDPQATAAGGMALALLMSLLIAAVGAQTFYPKELSLGVWCAIGLLMRASLLQSYERTVPEAALQRAVARPTKPSRERRAAARLKRNATNQSGDSWKRQNPVLPSAARWSTDTGKVRTGKWNVRQTR